MKRARIVVAAVGLGVGLIGCQPEEEEAPVPPGAVPAAPDVRPGTEAAPGGAAQAGAAADSTAGVPREEPVEGPESAEAGAGGS